MRVKVKGFKIYKDRHGKQRCYHRKTGVAIDLEKHPIGSPSFLAKCNEIAQKEKAATAGTFGLLVKEYKTNNAFLNLSERTQRDYKKMMNYLRPLNDIELELFDRAYVMRIRDKAEQSKSWHFANYVTRFISLLFNWGKDRGIIDANPAEGIKGLKRPKDKERANRVWADEEITAVLEHAPSHLLPPIAMIMFTGARIGDALALPLSAYDGAIIRFRTQKTGQSVIVPAPKILRDILDAMPQHDTTTLFVNRNGNPWNYNAFRQRWQELKQKLEKEGLVNKGLTLHGLRHTVAGILRQEGVDLDTIADYLGQASDKMARHYSRDADLEEKMQKAGKVLDMALQRRSKMSNLRKKVSNP